MGQHPGLVPAKHERRQQPGVEPGRIDAGGLKPPGGGGKPIAQSRLVSPLGHVFDGGRGAAHVISARRLA